MIRRKLKDKIKRIKTIILDVDGVMTDGGIYKDSSGGEFRKFNVQDGSGIKMAIDIGFNVIFISGSKSNLSRIRASELGVKDIYYGNIRKGDILKKILKNKKLEKDEIAYIGDDVIDIPILNEVGFSAVVRNANRKAKRYADYICRRNGGDGAVREVIDLIFKIQKKEQDAFSRYFDPSRYERL